jgi:glycerol-3-phosphate acyltransferase PlsY
VTAATASQMAATAAPSIVMLRHESEEVFIAVSIISVVLILRHKANIQKLLAGTEDRIGAKKKAQPETPSGDGSKES